MNIKINKNGFWESKKVDKKRKKYHDNKLATVMIDFLKNKNINTIVDFGCGLGNYAKVFLKNNFVCDAFDGNPYTPELTENIGKIQDLSVKFDLEKKYDCVVCLEVGEHIPKQSEQDFIDNVCKHSNNLIILSWAIPNQGGTGHVNCRTNNYIINELLKRNFSYDKENTIMLRNNISNAKWFKNTIMVFFKKINKK